MGNRDLIKDGVNGYLITVNDVNATVEALQKLIDNPGLRSEMGQKGRMLIKDYALEKVLEKMEEIYSRYLK